LLLVSVLINASYYFLKPDHLEFIFGLQFLSSLTGGPMSVLLWAMYADTADYGEWKRGRRATGLVFSASTMSQKFGWAICGWAAGQMLTFTGFVANAPVQKPEVLDGLRHMMSTVPAAFGVLAIIILQFFPLNERRMAEIETELNARRRKAAETP
ncbi:MAG TPA: MFS transporter, partial [Candidatus Synoicihabitans sp.]|nr:MFS transporter [Candidatus Synoicihabitans sp.]